MYKEGETLLSYSSELIIDFFKLKYPIARCTQFVGHIEILYKTSNLERFARFKPTPRF